jgi:sterol-4alpha-carboxylate 3-dehydrogenase (decarboxylating)
VGAAIVRALKARGDEVIVLDLAPKCPVEGVDYRRIDITDKAAVAEACRGVDTIIHNASIVHTKQNKQDIVWAVNLGGTESMLEAARQQSVPRFVYISSGKLRMPTARSRRRSSSSPRTGRVAWRPARSGPM